MLARIIIAAALLVAVYFAAGVINSRVISLLLYMIPYLVIGYDILIAAGKGIKNLQPFDEYFLMAVATIGAFVIGFIDSGDYIEAVAVMLFYQIGELFQSYAVGKSRKNIGELMDIRPDYANIEEDGALRQVDPYEVEVGTVIIVNPGEKIPIDGIVEEGVSVLDTSALTGESLPRDVLAGSEVLSGCINLSGVLKIRTTKEFGEDTASKILDMVENASSLKSRSENFISRFAKIYTPLVCLCALLLAVLPPVVRMLSGMGADWTDWIYRALTFLVISCPCALVISIPLSFFAGLGGASKAGVLIKGSNYLEMLSSAKIMVFDKTGTLTKGTFEVTAVHGSREDIIRYAAFAECASSHPIAQSIRHTYIETYNEEVPVNRTTDIEEHGGKGVTACVDGVRVAAGNERLMNELGLSPARCAEGGTIIHVAIDGEYAGHIHIADVLKPTSRQALAELKRAGIRKNIILTGDGADAAEAAAAELGADEVCSNLLPADKVAKVEELLAAKGGRDKLVFAGDGINDAPVISRADIGIARGAAGSDAAIEAADIVLMDDDPMKVVKAIRISKKCMRIVYENIVFSLAVKAICLVLGALGIANMGLAIFADVGVMIIAVLNAVRALFVSRA